MSCLMRPDLRTLRSSNSRAYHFLGGTRSSEREVLDAFNARCGAARRGKARLGGKMRGEDYLPTAVRSSDARYQQLASFPLIGRHALN